MASPTLQFNIRPALPSPTDTDALFILSAFDSCIPHLTTIGSGSQWGSQPFSTARPDALPRLVDTISSSHAYSLSSPSQFTSTSTPTHQLPPTLALIAEALLPTGEKVPVGAATLKGNWWPGYITNQEHLKGVVEGVEQGGEGKWVYLEMLVTSFEEGKREYRKGAGAALVNEARRWVEEQGVGVMFVDCWGGNGGRLARFYESQGFTKVDDFLVEKSNGEKWPGVFSKMDLGKTK